MAFDLRVPLTVLLLEDEPDDAELTLLELRRAGFEPRARRVETEADFLAALDAGYALGQPWDLVLGDYTLPHFTGVRALALMQQRGSDLPFILISGTVGEDVAVQAMRDGAADYLLKGRLARLQPAVTHVLEEHRLRHDKRAAERAASASARRFRALIENSADGIGVVAKDGRLNYLSPASARVLGFAPDQMVGRNPFDFVHPDDLAQVKAVIREVLRNPGGSREAEYRLRHGDGSWRTIHTHISNLLAEPSVAGIVFNYRDITAKKRDEAALLDSEQRYRMLFDSNPLPMWVYDLESLAFLAVNDAAIEHYGYSREEFLGMTIRDIRPPGESARLDDNLEMPHQTQERSGPWRHRRKDGRAITVEINSHDVTFNARPARLVLANDISERSAAEKALRESERRFRGLFDNSPIALWEEDFSPVKRRLEALRAQGITDFRSFFASHPEVVAEYARLIQIIDVNNIALSWYGAASKDELLGSVDNLFGPETDTGFQNQLVGMAEGQTHYQWEGKNRTLQGEELFVSLSWSAALGHEEDLARVIVSTVNITQRKRDEEELRQAEEKYRLIVENSIEGIFQTTTTAAT